MESSSYLKDNPGIIILPNKKVVRTTKIKKWIDKHKPIEYSITYLEPIPTDFRDVERGLKELENNSVNNVTQDIADEVEVLIKYDGYLKRQEQQIETAEKLEKYRIPADFDYSNLKHISTESKEKLEKIRPTNLAQASRIGGVKPADISVLMVLLKK